MEEDGVIELLDTPRKFALETQATQLRTVLKDFERSFAIGHDGQKPSKDDIKANTLIALKYKEYNRVRDVLAGKLDLASLIANESPKRKRHSRTDSGLGWTPRKRQHANTPRKSIRANDIDPYDAPNSASPSRNLLRAIGPTPHRDGKALGLFDLLSTPGSRATAMATPSAEREIDCCSTEKRSRDKIVTATPRQHRRKHSGDLLDFLGATPGQEVDTGYRRHSRTPASEGKKFLLSQLFATPSTTRYTTFMQPEDSARRTPLRDLVLGHIPQPMADDIPTNASPNYLRRSTSFKDRLLSASQSADVTAKLPVTHQSGPPTLRHFRSAARIISQLNSRPEEAEDEHEDEMDILREMEGSEVNAIVGAQQDTNMQGTSSHEPPLQTRYKKKGQKRTTRRAMIRPTVTKTHEAPNFVGADNFDEEDEDDGNETKQTSGASKADEPDQQAFSSNGGYLETEGQEQHNIGRSKTFSRKVPAKQKSKWEKMAKEVLGTDLPRSDSGKVKNKTVNPNAYSHMNFRTLKIKNKNSKAKGGGRGRFGSNRR